MRRVQRAYNARRRRWQLAGLAEKLWLLALSSVGLWRLREFDACLAHFSCKDIGQMGACRGRTKHDVRHGLVLPRQLLSSTCFEHCFVENPVGNASQLCKAVGAPALELTPWKFATGDDDRADLVDKPTGLWAGSNNKPSNFTPAPTREKKLRATLQCGEWMDKWVGDREFAREATPPGMARVYAELLVQ